MVKIVTCMLDFTTIKNHTHTHIPLCGFLSPCHYSQLEKFPTTRKEPPSPSNMMTYSHWLTGKKITTRETLSVPKMCSIFTAHY